MAWHNGGRTYAPRERRASRVAALVAAGFDASFALPFGRGWRVRCSQCEALVINGVPAHERGCPNQTKECRECGGVVPPGGTCCD